MELFGRQLGAEEVASLVFMLGALGVWVMALRGERRQHRWFKRWNAERKARREAEDRAEGRLPPEDPGPRSGPWG